MYLGTRVSLHISIIRGLSVTRIVEAQAMRMVEFIPPSSAGYAEMCVCVCLNKLGMYSTMGI